MANNLVEILAGARLRSKQKDGILVIRNSKIKHKVADFSGWRNKNQATTRIKLVDFSSCDLRNQVLQIMKAGF